MITVLLAGVVFDTAAVARTDEDKEIRKTAALKNFRDFLRPYIEKPLGSENFRGGIDEVFQALQNPLMNKHVRLQAT